MKVQTFSLFFLVGQLTVAVRIALSELGWFPLPCFGQSCEIMGQDPLLRSIPMGVLGVGYGLCMALLMLVNFRVRTSSATDVARHLSFIASLISVLLILRGLVLAGGVCHWCLAHAVLCVATALCLAMTPFTTPARVPVVALAVSAAFWCTTIVFAVSAITRSPQTFLAGLQSLSRQDLLSDTVPLVRPSASPDSDVRFIVFVDFDCGSCVALMKELHTSPRASVVRLRFIPTKGPGRITAGLLQENLTHPSYVPILDFVLESSPNESLLRRFIEGEEGFASPSPVPKGTDLARHLGIRASPTIVSLKGETATPSSQEEVLADLASK